MIFICCKVLRVSGVTPCHPSTESNAAHPSWKARWNTKIWSPKMTLLRKQKPSKGYNSIMGRVGDRFLPVIKTVFIAQIYRGLWLKYSTFFWKRKKTLLPVSPSTINFAQFTPPRKSAVISVRLSSKVSRQTQARAQRTQNTFLPHRRETQFTFPFTQ